MKDILTYKGFIGSVHFSTDDRVFYGKIEGIDDLITFEGSSVDELESGFKYMVEEHINDCEIEQKKPLKSYNGSLNVRLNPELHQKAANSAMLKNISLNKFIQKAIEKAVML